jgi:hypothetical protein
MTADRPLTTISQALEFTRIEARRGSEVREWLHSAALKTSHGTSSSKTSLPHLHIPGPVLVFYSLFQMVEGGFYIHLEALMCTSLCRRFKSGPSGRANASKRGDRTLLTRISSCGPSGFFFVAHACKLEGGTRYSKSFALRIEA